VNVKSFLSGDIVPIFGRPMTILVLCPPNSMSEFMSPEFTAPSRGREFWVVAVVAGSIFPLLVQSRCWFNLTD